MKKTGLGHFMQFTRYQNWKENRRVQRDENNIFDEFFAWVRENGRIL